MRVLREWLIQRPATDKLPAQEFTVFDPHMIIFYEDSDLFVVTPVYVDVPDPPPAVMTQAEADKLQGRPDYRPNFGTRL